MKGPKYSIKSGSKCEIVLAEYCENCDGEGVVGFDAIDSNPERDCTECDGIGYFTTEDGAQILALVNDILIIGGKK